MHQTFLNRFLLFIWLLFAVSWCLVSALTQAGGGGLLFRFASSVQSCCGEGGALQAAVAVCGELSPCPGRAARGLALSPRVLCAFSPRGGQPRRLEVRTASPWVLRAFSLRGERPGQPEVWRPLHGHAAPFPYAAPARAAGRVSGSL